MGNFLDTVTAFANPASAVIGGITSLISGNSAAKSAKEGQIAANQTNLQIARETNENQLKLQREANQANLDLARQQNDWNLDQWRRENAYNSPENQLKLYREAGINPNMMDSAGGFQPAPSIESADLANQQAAQLQRPAPVENTEALSSQLKLQARENAVRQATSMLDAIGDYNKKKQEVIASKTGVELTKRQIKQVDANIELINENKLTVRSLRPQQVRELESRIEMQYSNAALSKNESLMSELNRKYRKVELQIIKAQKPALSLQAAATLANIEAQTRLYSAQRGVAFSQAALNNVTKQLTDKQVAAFDKLNEKQLRVLQNTAYELHQRGNKVHNENEVLRWTIRQLADGGCPNAKTLAEWMLNYYNVVNYNSKVDSGQREEFNFNTK